MQAIIRLRNKTVPATPVISTIPAAGKDKLLKAMVIASAPPDTAQPKNEAPAAVIPVANP